MSDDDHRPPQNSDPYGPPSDPYGPPSDEDSAGVVSARLVDDSDSPSRRPGKPSGWRERIEGSWLLTLLMVFVVIMVTMFVFVVISTLSLVAAEWLVLRQVPADAAGQSEAMAAVLQSRLGFVLTILPPQLSLLVVPLAAAWLLPEGPRRGLRFVRGRWPIWAWIAAAVATPFVGLLSALIVSGFVEESESLKNLTEAFRVHGQSGFLLPIALLIGLAPAVCEEVLFRGFLQPRLTRLMWPSVGVVLASLAFAVFHVDPVHVVAVFPLGLWLGFLSYRSGSIFPAIIGHFVNNVLSVVAVMSEDTGALDIPDAIITVPIVAGGIVGLVAVAYASWRWRVE